MLLLGSHGPLAAGCIHQSSFSRHLSPGQQVLHVSQILWAVLSQTFDNILFPLELHKVFNAFMHLKLLFQLLLKVPSLLSLFFFLFELD